MPVSTRVYCNTSVSRQRKSIVLSYGFQVLTTTDMLLGIVETAIL